MSRVPTPLRHPKQRLADVQCSRMQFEPGDKLIVNVNHPLDKDAHTRLMATIQKWAGVDVNILIVDRTQMQVRLEKAKKQGEIYIG